MTRFEAFQAIDTERQRQESKWGGEHAHGWGSCATDGIAPMVKVAVLTEEVGEVARAALDQSDADLWVELVQVAAVAVAWLESM